MKLFFSRIGVGMLFSVLCGIIMPHTAFGQQENFTLTITPPLFQLTIGPGEFWTSSVKIVNANAYDITVYASAVDFKQYGEEGQEMFMPLFERKAGEPSHALASWLELPSDGTFIKKGESREIPFSLRIPADADPGSHYAAILVGTRPLKEPQNESVIKVSSMVSSLLFARIKGDIRESGFIREFSADHALYERPGATFTLRFKNTGNVHVRPQGDVVVTDMWGNEKGKIFINKETDFGNVLPQTTRKFPLVWDSPDGAASFPSFGRYKAIATLAYGDDARQSGFATTYFWVVPIRLTASIALTIFIVFLLVLWMIKRHVRYALEREMRVRIAQRMKVRTRWGLIVLVGAITLLLVFLIMVGNDASSLWDRAGHALRAFFSGRRMRFP